MRLYRGVVVGFQAKNSLSIWRAQLRLEQNAHNYHLNGNNLKQLWVMVRSGNSYELLCTSGTAFS